MEIVVLIVILIFLSIVLFICLNKLLDSTSESGKDYYFKIINELDEEILKKNESLKNGDKSESLEDKKEIEIVSNNNIDKDLLDVMKNTDYASDNPLEIAKKVDEIFYVNEEEILKNFISNMKVNDDYVIYQRLYNRFSPNFIYKLKTLNDDSQIKVIRKLITDEEREVFDSYLEVKKFKLDKFLLDLNLLIERNVPFIEVMVGTKRKDYSNLSKYIKMVYTDDIYKGMIIKYQDRIYDYSINERDVS